MAGRGACLQMTDEWNNQPISSSDCYIEGNCESICHREPDNWTKEKYYTFTATLMNYENKAFEKS